jgi:hypothetical protein
MGLYAECRYAECLYAECRDASHYAESFLMDHCSIFCVTAPLRHYVTLSLRH